MAVVESLEDIMGKVAKPNRIQVWYHGNCDDGFGAAWAAHHFFDMISMNPKNVLYIPVHYNKPMPEVEATDIVYIVDFSYPRELIEDLKTRVVNLSIIDHHKTAQEDLQGLDYATFDMSQSGAVLTWKFFHDDLPVPKLLKYVQANDLWQHKSMPDTQAVIRYIRSLPQDFLEWDKLHAKFETKFSSLIGEAQAIERYFQAQVAFQVQHARMELIGGHKCPVINTTVTFISELCNAMHEQFGTDISMSYLIKPDNSAMISLRSAGRVDVSAIAKKHGGGGHHNSAGFHIPVAQLVEFLEGRTLL